jgi:hypothetical protein
MVPRAESRRVPWRAPSCGSSQHHQHQATTTHQQRGAWSPFYFLVDYKYAPKTANATTESSRIRTHALHFTARLKYTTAARAPRRPTSGASNITECRASLSTPTASTYMCMCMCMYMSGYTGAGSFATAAQQPIPSIREKGGFSLLSLALLVIRLYNRHRREARRGPGHAAGLSLLPLLSHLLIQTRPASAVGRLLSTAPTHTYIAQAATPSGRELATAAAARAARPARRRQRHALERGVPPR